MEISSGWCLVKNDLEEILDGIFLPEVECQYQFDSLLSVEEINKLGYIRNFPHLTCLGCSISEGEQTAFSRNEMVLDRSFQPQGVDFVLLPATCYKVYLKLQNTEIEDKKVVGCEARCFRHEDKPLDKFRHLNFTMKEFVCLGSEMDARHHLESGLSKIAMLFNSLNIPFDCVDASDPFFDTESSPAILSRLIPTKREFLFEGCAVASTNFHRNYFGEKFNISHSGSPVNTSCIAFGIERWIAMYSEVFGSYQAALSAQREAKRRYISRN